MEVHKLFKRIAIVMWLVMLGAIWGYYLYNPSYFQAENIANVLSEYEGHLLVVYTLVGVLRGLTLLPNLTLIVAGTLLFPDNYVLLLLSSVFGITVSSLTIYYFSEFLGFDKLFNSKYPKKIEYIQEKMNKYGVAILLLWSFLPIVPSDLISYVSGTIKFNLTKFIAGIFVGHAIIYVVVIFFSDTIFNIFF